MWPIVTLAARGVAQTSSVWREVFRQIAIGFATSVAYERVRDWTSHAYNRIANASNGTNGSPDPTLTPTPEPRPDPIHPVEYLNPMYDTTTGQRWNDNVADDLNSNLHMPTVSQPNTDAPLEPDLDSQSTWLRELGDMLENSAGEDMTPQDQDNGIHPLQQLDEILMRQFDENPSVSMGNHNDYGSVLNGTLTNGASSEIVTTNDHLLHSGPTFQSADGSSANEVYLVYADHGYSDATHIDPNTLVDGAGHSASGGHLEHDHSLGATVDTHPRDPIDLDVDHGGGIVT